MASFNPGASNANITVVVNAFFDNGNALDVVRSESLSLSESVGCQQRAYLALGPTAFVDSCDRVGFPVGRAVHFYEPNADRTWAVEVTFKEGAPVHPSASALDGMLQELLSGQHHA